METGQKTFTISIKKVLKWILILIVAWVVIMFGYRIFHRSMGVSVGDDVSMGGVAEVAFDGGSRSGMMLASPMRDFMPWSGNAPTVRDTREFNKVSYNGTIKTRDVSDTARDVRGIVRDMDGRIDSESVNEKYSYISFVIPKDSLDDFRDEIESITHKKLYIENTSSQNLLGQKQQIEEQKTNATMSLAELQAQQKTLTAQHKVRVAALEKQLAVSVNKWESQRATFNAMENDDPTHDQTLAEMNAQAQQNDSIRKQLIAENNTYANQNGSLNSQIQAANGTIAQVKKTDQAFTDNIETVNGSVSIQWVNLWQLADAYLPFNPIFIVIILAIIIWYILRKRNVVPMFVVKW